MKPPAKKSAGGDGGGAAPAVSRVLIVDDHPIVRTGLAAIIDHEADLKVVAQAEGMAEAMAIVQRVPLDLAIVDISLRDGGGLELIKNVRALDSSLKILVLSMYDELIFAERALEAGAKGYLNKEEPPQKTVEALRKMRDGMIVVSDRVMQAMLNRGNRKSHRLEDLLSDRELEIFELIGRGNGTGEIARRLHRSKKTVETHRERMKDKLGLDNGNQLTVMAVRWLFELGGYQAGGDGDGKGEGGEAKIAEQAAQGMGGDGEDDEPDAPAGRGAKLPTNPKEPKGPKGPKSGVGKRRAA